MERGTRASENITQKQQLVKLCLLIMMYDTRDKIQTKSIHISYMSYVRYFSWDIYLKHFSFQKHFGIIF